MREGDLREGKMIEKAAFIFFLGIGAYYSLRDLFIYLRGEPYILNSRKNHRNEYIFLGIYVLVVLYFFIKEKNVYTVISTGLIYIFFKVKSLIGDKTILEVFNVRKEEIIEIMKNYFEQKKITYRIEKENKVYLPFENLTFEILGSKNHARLECIKEYNKSDCSELVKKIISELDNKQNQNFEPDYSQILYSSFLFIFNFVLFFYFIF